MPAIRLQETPTVNPEMVVLARESRGLTASDLARRMSVTPGLISQIESGLCAVTPERLAQLSTILDYARAFFEQQQTVRGLGPSLLFHRRRKRVPSGILRKAHARANVLLMHLAEMLRVVEVPEVRILPLDAEKFGRRAADVARAVRASWGLPSGPVRSLVQTIEAAGGIVIPFDFDTRHIDALSLAAPDMPPVFFVNPHAPVDRTRFSLCHEVGHVVMHRQGILEPDIEREADEFAAEFLLPESDIKTELVRLTMPKAAAMKPYWRVSMAAIITRASDLRAISQTSAQRLWRAMASLGYRRQEPEEIDIPRETETPRLYREIIASLRDEMNYGVSEFSHMLSLHEDEVRQLYFGMPKNLRLIPEAASHLSTERPEGS